MQHFVEEALAPQPDEDYEVPFMHAVDGDIESGDDEWGPEHTDNVHHQPSVDVDRAGEEGGSSRPLLDRKAIIVIAALVIVWILFMTGLWFLIDSVGRSERESRLNGLITAPIDDLSRALSEVVEADIRSARLQGGGKCDTTPHECMADLRRDNPGIYGDAHVLTEEAFADLFYGLRAKDAVVSWRRTHYKSR